MTVQDIRPNPQDTTVYYLANILQQLNGTQVPALPNPIVSFTPPTWSVWVNGLWFMSLVISLTCALLATFLQQWARRYLISAYPRYGPQRRARIRTFQANMFENFRLQKVVELLPALLHISLFLFLAGLAVFLFNVNFSIFKAVIAWIGLCVLSCSYFAIWPILHKNGPVFAQFSGAISFCLTGIRSTVAFFNLVERFPGLINRFPSLPQLRNRGPRTVQVGEFSHSKRLTAELFAFRLGPEIDLDSLMWMFQSLDENKELERFFEGDPDRCDSKMVTYALKFIKQNEKMFSNALIDLMDRTLSSNLVSEAVVLRRIIICTKAGDATSPLGPWWILRRVLLGDWKKFLGYIEFALFVQKWKSIAHPATRFYAQCVAAVTISSVQEHDDRWFQLAGGPMGASKDLFQDYLKHRDSILLANAISILRQTIQAYSGSAERYRSDILGASSKTLESLRSLDHRHTFPDLQHEFCAVWNQLVDLAQNDDRAHIVCVATATLKSIRQLYIGLHKGTSAAPTSFSGTTNDGAPVLDDARSYSGCDVVGHRSLHPVPKLEIEESAPEVTSNAPPTTVASARTTNSTLILGAVHPPINSPTPPHSRSPTQASTLSYRRPHLTCPTVPPYSPRPSRPLHPSCSSSPSSSSSHGSGSNEGTPSASAITPASSSRLGRISSSTVGPG